MSNNVVGGVGYSETETQTNSPKVNLYYIAALQTSDCAQLVPNGSSPVQTDLSAGAPCSGAKCTERHRQQPETQKGQAQSSGGTETLWKAGRDHSGSDDMEIMKKKTAAVVLLGWVCEVDRMQLKQGAGAAMEGGRTGDTGTTAAVSGSLRWKVETQLQRAAGHVPVINNYYRN